MATNRIAEISRESLRKILKAEGVSWQAVKTWKAGTDPEFATKMNRILDLYDHRPVDGRVICVDEFGPLNLQPRAGRGWFRQRKPKRLRATYNRTQGVRHLLGALDLATGKIHYRIRDRKRWQEFLGLLKSLRALTIAQGSKCEGSPVRRPYPQSLRVDLLDAHTFWQQAVIQQLQDQLLDRTRLRTTFQAPQIDLL